MALIISQNWPARYASLQNLTRQFCQTKRTAIIMKLVILLKQFKFVNQKKLSDWQNSKLADLAGQFRHYGKGPKFKHLQFSSIKLQRTAIKLKIVKN